MSLLYSLEIRSNIRNYTAEIHENYDFFNQLATLPHHALMVDKNVYTLYNDILNKRFDKNKIFIFDAIEQNKTFETAEKIYSWLLTEFSAKRNLNFISIGGGITMDVSGFVASTLYRGINWYYVPTTLLSQVDSCIGSKTSLNFKTFKNLLGTFYPPYKIFINPNFTKTLSNLDLASGMGEIIKFLLMKGLEQGEISNIPNMMQKISSSQNNLAPIIHDCLNIKRSYMENDEFDTGLRNLLNFGHCFGHALENASNYYIPHGIAVNIGIIFASIVAVQRKAISQDTMNFIIHEICLPAIIQKQRISDYNVDYLLNNIKNDKKRTGAGLPLVYPTQNGLYKTLDLSEEEFRSALNVLIKILFT